jgi:hypothetical protein
MDDLNNVYILIGLRGGLTLQDPINIKVDNHVKNCDESIKCSKWHRPNNSFENNWMFMLFPPNCKEHANIPIHNSTTRMRITLNPKPPQFTQFNFITLTSINKKGYDFEQLDFEP